MRLFHRPAFFYLSAISFSCHPETYPLVRLTKDLAVRRTPIAINLRAFSFGEGGTKCRKRTKTPILKTHLIQQGLRIIKTILFSQRLYAVDSSAYARRAPFVVQCRWHFRHFPRFAGELPHSETAFCGALRLDVSTTLMLRST